ERGVVVVPPERIAEVLDELLLRGEVVQDGSSIYTRRMYEAEVELAKEVARLIRARRARVPQVELEGGGLRLAAGQKAALLQVETTPLCIITGGPGTGKTTIIRTLVGAWARGGLRVKLAAPTGRAAKRLAEATGQPASTLHRLLAVVPGEDFSRRSESDLGVDLLVCDEASMLDLQLALTLLRAVPVGATLVLVGDVDQLPSVGPGRVLNDLIESGRVPTTRLREIFRQAEGSSIVENAHRILAGQVPLPAPRTSELHDFYLIETDDALQARERVVKLVAERIPARFNLDPLLDVQVLTPMHRGEVGTEELNRALQAALNPQAATTGGAAEAGSILKSRGRSFALSDKVMQVRNDYERDVWNGDVGLVVQIDPEEGTLTVRFDDEREVLYDGDELDQLELAYAVSVHKAQGSEYKAVVIPLHLQHYPLLRRNLLYTAVTRGKQLVVLVGSQRALRRAVGQTGDLKRYTQLAERVRSILPT
ncbi:MAG TPA: AAA family ATPase, partial [Pseudomonadota bacterium]|nr:AAA family ATPase [Pseudomonadota bacterium]